MTPAAAQSAVPTGPRPVQIDPEIAQYELEEDAIHRARGPLGRYVQLALRAGTYLIRRSDRLPTDINTRHILRPWP